VKCVVVGAGLAGATAARKVSLHPDWEVEVYEAAPEVGGNLRSSSIAGVLYEPYGPHIFTPTTRSPGTGSPATRN
jgi:UDP-galactopyranose mutase